MLLYATLRSSNQGLYSCQTIVASTLLTLRARADFRTVLAHYGIATNGSGDQVKALCPLHDDERRASRSASPKVFHCFAPNCPAHEGGDILDFVHLIETHRGTTTSLRQAGDQLANMCGLDTRRACPATAPGRP